MSLTMIELLFVACLEYTTVKSLSIMEEDPGIIVTLDPPEDDGQPEETQGTIRFFVPVVREDGRLV